MSIEKTLASFVKQLTQSEIVIAYSGGVDSQVLLYALASLQAKGLIQTNISVFHANHGISEHAAHWQAIAKQQAEQFDFPFITANLNVKKQAQQSLEALARDARYNAMKTLLPNGSCVVTGHHRNDQVESFLLALKRGAGVNGLGAMQMITSLGELTLARPLLSHSRLEIVEYARQHQLQWIEDDSNSDTQFDRNFLRHQVIPLMEERWQGFTKTVARSAQHCQEANHLLKELAEQDYQLVKTQSGLSIAELSKLSAARFNHVIRHTIALAGGTMPSVAQLQQARQQLFSEQDKVPEAKLGSLVCRRFQGAMYITPVFEDISAVEIAITEEAASFVLPDRLGNLSVSRNDIGGLAIKAPDEDTNAQIRFAHSNPKCLPDYRQQHRSLKKVLQELNIPPWQRKRVPLLFYGDTFVAALGYFVCKPFVATAQENTLYVNWQSNDSSA